MQCCIAAFKAEKSVGVETGIFIGEDMSAMSMQQSRERHGDDVTQTGPQDALCMKWPPAAGM